MAPRTPFIAGNWKMHKTLEESRVLASSVARRAAPLIASGKVHVGVYPTSLALALVAGEVRSAGVRCGAQNLHPADEGAFTGEISGRMIRAAGGDSVLIGHSERRHIFGEGDSFVSKKVAAALAADLTPVLCVGELVEERDAGRTLEVVGTQLREGLAGVETAEGLARAIIAYEPVWAIGTGRTASPEQAQEVHAFVRRGLGELFAARGGDPSLAGQSLILYGGSVKPGNAGELIGQPDVDGALVGGASLDADAFLGICEACLSG